MLVHCEVPPIPVKLRQEFLYDMDPEKLGLIKATVFSFSSYQGEAPTVTVMVEDTQAIFSYMPLSALVSRKIDKVGELPLLQYLSRINCPSIEFVIHTFEYLKGLPCVIYYSPTEEPISASYHFTVDWYKDNQQHHFLELSNGHFVLWPQHKIIWSRNPHGLPKYKKMHSIWRI